MSRVTRLHNPPARRMILLRAILSESTRRVCADQQIFV